MKRPKGFIYFKCLKGLRVNMKSYKIFKRPLWVFTMFVVSSAFAENDSTNKLDVALRIEYGIGFSTIYYQDYETIRRFAGVLNRYPHTKLYIWGHTDSVGTHDTNQELSDSRAENIKKLLVKFDVKEDRITTKGMSEDYPIAPNTDRFGRARNRRSVARISGLGESEVQKFKAVVKESNLMALIGDKGKFLNPDKSFDDFYETQVASMGGQKKPQTFETVETKTQDKGRRETASEEGVKLNKSYFEVGSSLVRQRRNTVFGFFMPNWSSKYYEGDVSTEHGKFSPLGFGVGFKRDFSNKWYGKAHAYYLPTQVNEGTSGINFANTSSLDYEDNIYGITGGYYVFSSQRKSKLSLEASINAHIIGGLERTSTRGYVFDKYNHVGLGLGVNYERLFSEKWKIATGLHYLVPLSVSDVEAYSGKLWYRGFLGVHRDLTEKLKINFDYQALYHESEFEFASGMSATSEFLVQTLLIGMGYKF